MQNSEENNDRLAEATGDADVTELNHSEDVELDVLESLEELNNAKEEEPEHKEVPIEERQEQQEAQAVEPKEQEETKEDKSIAPPVGWKAEEKEWFNAQPLEAKQAISRRAKDMERHFHQVAHEGARLKQEFSDIEEAIKPYEKEWNAKGISRSQAIRALAAANSKLDEDLIGSVESILNSYGTTFDEAYQAYKGQSNGSSQPSAVNDPRMQHLTQQVEQLQQQLSQNTQAEQAAKQQSIVQELDAFANEKDAAGRYLRPELHDENFIAQHVTPLFQSLRAAYPNERPRDVMNMTYTTLQSKLGLKPRSFPTQQQSAKRATLSVPGSPVSSVQPLTKVPDSVDDTVLETARELGFNV